MNKKYKIIISVVVVVILGALVYNLFFKDSLAGANAAGTTNNTPRIAQTVCNNAATTSYASLLNSDANDRVVTSVDIFYTGYGQSALFNLGAGTSTAAGATSTTPLFVFVGVATTTDPIFIRTSQVNGDVSSSTLLTYPISSNAGRVWVAGSYLNFLSNATSSGYCTISVSYLPE